MKQFFRCKKHASPPKGIKSIAFETVYEKREYVFGIIMQEKIKAQVNYSKTLF